MFVTINHKMLNIKSLKPAVKHNESGTVTLPLFISISPGEKGRGKDFFTKVGDTVYSTNQKREKDGIHTLRCKRAKATQGEEKCGWTGKVMNTSGLNKTDSEYWNDHNWIMLMHPIAQNHTCCGVPYYHEAGNKFRQFVKDEAQNGETNYKTILEKRGVKRSMRQMRGL